MSLLQAGRRAPDAGCSLPWMRVAIVLTCTCLLACDVADEAPLLELSSIESREIALGDELRVQGRGLPTGAACLVRLRGQWAQPAQATRTVDVSLPAHALSDEDIVAPLLVDRLPEVALHATFAGEVTVTFAAAAGASRVSGTLGGVSFDVVRPNPDVTVRDQTLRRAQQTLKQLGIVLEDEPEDERGLRVAWAAEGSAADQAQLKQGDVLTHRDGLRLRATADAAPAVGATSVRVRVRPSDGSAVRDVELSLGRAQEPVLTQLGAIASAMAVLMLVCVMWLAPMPRRVVRFQSPVTSPVSSRGIGAASLQRDRSLAAIVAWPCLAAMSWVGMAMGHRWSAAAHLVVLCALLGAGHLVAQTSRRHGAERARGWIADISDLAVIFAPLASASLIAGSVTLVGVVEQQGALPWQWFAFKVPPLLLSAVVFVGGARRLVVAADAHHPTWASLLALVLAGVGSAVFFGGWQPPAGAVGMLDRDVLGIGTYVIKAWVLMLAMTWQSKHEVARFAGSIRIGLALASLALSVVWIRVDVPPSVELGLGYTLCGATLIVAVLRLWRTPRHAGLSL